jgi:hypothetical protein
MWSLLMTAIRVPQHQTVTCKPRRLARFPTHVKQRLDGSGGDPVGDHYKTARRWERRHP